VFHLLIYLVLKLVQDVLEKHLVDVECVWNLMAHGDAREGKWRGNWRMEWVASTLTLPWNAVYPASLTLMRKPRLPVVDWTDTPANLKGLVRFSERQNLVSARLPSRFKCTIPNYNLSDCYSHSELKSDKRLSLTVLVSSLCEMIWWHYC